MKRSVTPLKDLLWNNQWESPLLYIGDVKAHMLLVHAQSLIPKPLCIQVENQHKHPFQPHISTWEDTNNSVSLATSKKALKDPLTKIHPELCLLHSNLLFQSPLVHGWEMLLWTLGPATLTSRCISTCIRLWPMGWTSSLKVVYQ